MSSDKERAMALMAQAMKMLTEVEKVAAFGAHLRALTEPIEMPEAVAAATKSLAEALAPGVSELPVETLSMVKGGLVAFFRQAADLLEHPDRAPGWLTDDIATLQAQGRASALVVDILSQAIEQLDGVSQRFDEGGAFCDVGTGVGWLSIAAARTWPKLRVVGIDINPTVLELARANVHAEGVSERVELKELDACTLCDDAFDLIWLPGPFLPRAAVPQTLRSAHSCLNPGGWIAFGCYGGHDDLSERLADVRTVRSGGHPWLHQEIVAEATKAGYVDARPLERSWKPPFDLVVARRAA